METKFVVIIPTYNRPEKLRVAIKSVLRQTYKNYKIYVVDDCSDCANENKEIINEFVDNRISYTFLQENHGHSFARNFALTFVEDEDVWVKYLDDDNVLLKNCLKYFNEYIINHSNVNVITSNYVKVTDKREYKHPNYNIESVFNGNLNTCSICHHISMYSNFGGWDERLYRMADDDLFFNYITNCNYGYLNKMTSVFFDTSDSDRVTNKVGNLKYLNIIADKYPDYFQKVNCLVICDDIDELNNVNFHVESFMKFDLNERTKDAYDVFVQLKDSTDIVNLFDVFYKLENKKSVINFGSSMLVSNYHEDK